MNGEIELVIAPGLGQLGLAGLAGLCLLCCVVFGYRRWFGSDDSVGIGSSIWLLVLAMALNCVLISWRTVLHPNKCIPLADNFDAIILFATLLGVVLVYLMIVGRLSGIELAVVPVLAVCQFGAIFLAGAHFKVFGNNFLVTLHIGSVVISGGLFALAAASGALYLWENRQLRAHRLDHAVRTVPALESLEKLMAMTIMIGFAILSVSLLTGILDSQRLEGGLKGYLGGKVVIGGVIWLGYAALLHRRYWPRLSGTKAAWLAVSSFGVLVLLCVAMVLN